MMDAMTGGNGWMDEIVGESGTGGQGPGCSLAVVAVAFVVLMFVLLAVLL